MSTAIMAKCWPLQMPPTPKAVLISLADNANDQGDCWPSISTICERTCFGRTAVIDAIAWLEKHRAVVGDRANGRHTRYVVTPEMYVEPVREPDRSASRTGTPAGLEPVRLPDNQSASRTGPVRQADTNRKEPSLKATTKKQPSPPAGVLDFGSVDPAVVADFLKLRRAKRAPLTQTALDGIKAEADKAGLTLESALRLCCLRGWQGLDASWLKPHERGNSNTPAAPAPKTRQKL